MQKIKNSVIKKCIEQKLTSKEIDFLLYISHFQNSGGCIGGIYYRDVCEKTGISIQAFYDIKDSLIRKGIISAVKHSDIDYDITIENNEFYSSDSYNEGYISTNRKVFYTPEFRRLKGGEKLMLFDLMRLTYSNRGKFVIRSANFCEKYMKLLGITKRVVRGYLSNLKQFFRVQLHQFHYYIMPKDIIKENSGVSDDNAYDIHTVQMSCRRNRIKQLSEKALKDTAALITQYGNIAAQHGKVIVDLVLTAINTSLEIINKDKTPKEKYVRELRPTLIHKLIRESL